MSKDSIRKYVPETASCAIRLVESGFGYILHDSVKEAVEEYLCATDKLAARNAIRRSIEANS